MESGFKIYCDGGSRGNPGPAASACVIYQGETVVISLSKYLGKNTNNVAEYEAVILAYEWLGENQTIIGELPINFILDSELVVRQLNGDYKIKKDHLKILFDQIKKAESTFSKVTYTHVLRSKNVVADQLVNDQLDSRE
jgi:ribonuclease HI